MNDFWINFIFGNLQTILTTAIKNPESEKSKKIGEWLDRIDTLIDTLREKLGRTKPVTN